jgi:hypothetical protein
MSMHYDLVIVCDLREDTPEPCIELIRWLSDPASDPEAKPQFDCFSENDKDLADNLDYPFLASYPSEEVVTVFQRRYRYTTSLVAGRRDVYRYCLQYSARGILDDVFVETHILFVYWLSSLIVDGFIGYYKEELDNQPRLLYVKDRKLVESAEGT